PLAVLGEVCALSAVGSSGGGGARAVTAGGEGAAGIGGGGPPAGTGGGARGGHPTGRKRGKKTEKGANRCGGGVRCPSGAGGGASCGGADPKGLGPFYGAGARERAELCDAGEPGKRFELTCRLLGEGCEPLKGALVELWQADARGVYDMLAPGKPRDPAVYHL